jgi:hypothetical protein
MQMNKTRFLTVILSLFLLQSQARSQSQSTEMPKYEVAAEFTTMARESFGGRTEPGGGVRFTFNLNRMISFETAGYFFPKQCIECISNGNVTEVVGGVKIGKRFEHWGIFGKARPGVVSYSRGKFNVVPDPGNPGFPFNFVPERVNSFAADLGGVVEFYPSKHLVTRFDFGDTIVHFGPRPVEAIIFNQTTNTFGLMPLTLPSRNVHEFQFVTSVGWRF